MLSLTIDTGGWEKPCYFSLPTSKAMSPGPVVEAAAEAETEQQVAPTEETLKNKPQQQVLLLIVWIYVLCCWISGSFLVLRVSFLYMNWVLRRTMLPLSRMWRMMTRMRTRMTRTRTTMTMTRKRELKVVNFLLLSFSTIKLSWFLSLSDAH